MVASERLPWSRWQGPARRGAKAAPASALHVELPGRRSRRAAPVRPGQAFTGTGQPALGPATPGGAGADQGHPSRHLRRAADILGAAVLLLFTLPLQLAAAVLVRLESPGPALRREERVGLHGRPFALLGFRTTRGDARTTQVGRWLRLVRLDELPRLLNVLRGDMSLVGPAPEPPHVVAALSAQLPLYTMRHAVKPGLVGWAQVGAPHGASAADARARLGYDIFYVLHQGWRLDLRILLAALATILRAVPRGPGAR